MNLKAYLRGIGAGLIVAALVMGVSTGRSKEAPIDKERLIDTVSIAESSVSDSQDDIAESIDTSVETVTSTVSVSEEVKEVLPSVSEEAEDDKDLISEDVVESISLVSEDEPTPSIINPMPENEAGYTLNEEAVEIKIIKGDSSVSVARRMYEAGLVESAVEFDKFLCENGYDKYISVGTFEIANGSDFETMAKVITRRK